MKKTLITLLSVAAFAQIGSTQVLFDNGVAAGGSGVGGLVSPGVSGSGGAPISSITAGSGTIGFGHNNASDQSVTDDFSSACDVLIDSMTVFAYQTGSTTTSTITGMFLRIWDGAPNAGGTVVYGDTFTNVLAHTEWTGVYRVVSTAQTGTTRPVMQVTAQFPSAISLPGGTTYWFEWSLTGSLASGPWCPALNVDTINAVGNAMQSITNTWNPMVDGTTLLQQVVPFILYGNESPIFTSLLMESPTCNLDNGMATMSALTGVAPYTYMWNTGDTTNMVDSLAAGNYGVTVTDVLGCDASVSFSLTNTGVPMLSLSAMDVMCAGDMSGQASVMVTGGGVGGETYLWSEGSASDTISGVAGGMYYVTVTDAVGCAVMDSVMVNEPDSIMANAVISSNYNGEDISCNGAADGMITTAAVGGTGMLSYMWSNMATTSDISGLAAGSYTVTVMDVNGCAVMETVMLTEPTAIAITLTPTGASTVGGADGMVDLTAMGGTPTYNFLWSNNETTQNISGLVAGTYAVTITDMNGCMDTASVVVPDGVVGVSTTLSNTQYSVYPNPTQDVLTIESQVADIDMVIIHHSNGQQIAQYNAQQNRLLNIATREWTSGVYILSIYTSNGQRLQTKVVKQ